MSRESVPTSLWAVVLAAGESRRLGEPKQLVRWRDSTLIAHAVRAAQAVCGPHVVVVTGAHREKIEHELEPLAVTIAFNPRWADGLATSLGVGIGTLPPGCEAALLMACDQPLVPLESLDALAQRWRVHPDRAVASGYAGTIGVPAVLPARLFATIRTILGDRGARTVLHAEGERLEVVPVPEAALDVDDAPALAALLRG